MSVPAEVQHEFEQELDQYISDWSADLAKHVEHYNKLGKAADDDNTPGQRSYGSIHWEPPEESELYKLQDMLRNMVPGNALASWGREEDPHITLRYGLLDSDYSQLIPFLESLEPFEARIGQVHAFQPGEHSGDSCPIVLRIDSTQLAVVNEQLGAVANFKPSDFATFEAHMSIAYVKKELADGIVEELAPIVRMFYVGKPFLIDHAIISPAEGEQIKVEFGGSPLAKWLDKTYELPKLSKARKTITADPSKSTPTKTAAEAQIEQAVQNALEQAAEDYAKDAEEWLAEGVTADQVAEQMSRAAFDSAIPNVVADALGAVYAEAAQEQFTELKVDEAALFDLVNTDALAYAQERGAELVGRKWDEDGKLVENPDAEWAITDTTREGLKDLISRSYTEGWTPKQLATEITGSYTFSPERAQMIATTETNMASSNGILNSWKRSGLVKEKMWNMSEDHDIPDECDDNADEGWIPIDEDFPSGDDAPPAHPACICSLSASLSENTGG